MQASQLGGVSGNTVVVLVGTFASQKKHAAGPRALRVGRGDGLENASTACSRCRLDPVRGKDTGER